MALGEEVRVDGPVETERVGYRFFLQPTAVRDGGHDDWHRCVSRSPRRRDDHCSPAPGSVLDWKDGSRNRIVSVVGAAQDYDELRAINELLRREVVVTYANVSHVA